MFLHEVAQAHTVKHALYVSYFTDWLLATEMHKETSMDLNDALFKIFKNYEEENASNIFVRLQGYTQIILERNIETTGHL